jgi:hypothetical protein
MRAPQIGNVSDKQPMRLIIFETVIDRTGDRKPFHKAGTRLHDKAEQMQDCWAATTGASLPTSTSNLGPSKLYTGHLLNSNSIDCL